MGLYKFSIAAAASPSDIEAKITSVRGQGANIYLHSIVDIGNLNLSINNKNVTINYDLIGTKQNSLFNWYICDTVGYETIIILYNSGTESDSTFGLANYNRIYFNVKNQLVSNPKISATLAAQFNVLRGRFDSYESDGGDDDVIMLTKCVYNDGSNTETGEAIVTDNLYVSTNLRSTSFKTIVKDENNKQFINVGGIFYLPYSEEIIYPSWSPNQLVLPAGTVDYEWNPATAVITENVRWYDKTNINYLTYYVSSGPAFFPYYQKNKEDFSLDIKGGTTTSIYGMTLKDNGDKNRVYYIVGKPLNSSNTSAGFLYCYDTSSVINWPSTSNPDGIMMKREDQIIKIKYRDRNVSLLYQYVDYPEENLIVFAIKASPQSFVHSTYLSELSCYFNGNKKIECSFQDSVVGKKERGISLAWMSLKFFAIVDHDQTSEEIIKTSQLLMDKFDIH